MLTVVKNDDNNNDNNNKDVYIKNKTFVIIYFSSQWFIYIIPVYTVGYVSQGPSSE